MSRFCPFSTRAGLALLVLALGFCEARGRGNNENSTRIAKSFSGHIAHDPLYTCAAYGECCADKDNSCGPEHNDSVICYCDDWCETAGDCCPDHQEFCHACDHPYVNVQGKCMAYVGQFTYYYARKECENQGATIVMPRVEEDWTNFVQSGYYKDVTGGDQFFEFWLNCRMSVNEWYWRVPGVPFPGEPVVWNNFPYSPTNKKTAGLIGVAVGSANPWSWSKQWRPKHTFCQKIE